MHVCAMMLYQLPTAWPWFARDDSCAAACASVGTGVTSVLHVMWLRPGCITCPRSALLQHLLPLLQEHPLRLYSLQRSYFFLSCCICFPFRLLARLHIQCKGGQVEYKRNAEAGTVPANINNNTAYTCSTFAFFAAGRLEAREALRFYGNT